MMKKLKVVLLVAVAALSSTACVTDDAPPPGLNLELTRATNQKLYTVALKSLEEPIVVNKIHPWEILLTNANGEPIDNARIKVDGGMPQHGHGFPTQPRVTKNLGNGRYLLEGVKFSMTGWWEIKLDIQSALGNDQITLNKVIALPVKK
ncbi:MAG TPA: FixH family protein [Paucimonas sp.]|nr:FixH family protein [Paucimonas sp.]